MAEDCTPKCGDLSSPISSSSVIYKGELLTCIGADIPDTLESIVKKLDKAICQKLSDISALNRFINTGAGIELYTGQTVFGQNQIASLSSPDNSVNITYNPTTEEVNIEVDFPAIQNYVFTSDGTVNITRTTSAGTDTIDLSVVFPPEEFLTLEAGTGISIVDGTALNSKRISAVTTASYVAITGDSTITVTQTPDGSAASLSVNFPDPPIVPEQVQSDVLVTDNTSKAFIQNQNPTKVITSSINLSASDNNKVIIADTTQLNQAITITVPTPGSVGFPPTSNYFVGIIQKGTQTVTISGATSIPTGFQNKIEGNGHNAAIEIIPVSGTSPDVFLLGSLKSV